MKWIKHKTELKTNVRLMCRETKWVCFSLHLPDNGAIPVTHRYLGR